MDIEKCQVWSLEPDSGICGYETFTDKIAAVAFSEDGTGVRPSTRVAYLAHDR